ncbi:MAG: hypothetical protein AB7P76_02935 [Candidatus Melainabacteria bacterium]
MFFAALCLLLYLLIANKVQPDMFGWLMLVGTGWFAGYLDGRVLQRSDKDPDRVLPPDVTEDSSDRSTFQH